RRTRARFADVRPGYSGAVSTAVPAPSVVIEPDRGLAPHLGELWTFRELFYFLMWRDIKVRYKQTALGAAWALVQPLLLMLLVTANVRFRDVRYAVPFLIQFWLFASPVAYTFSVANGKFH